MSNRSVPALFDQYQRSRLEFAKNVAELSLRHTNIPLLEQANVLDLLKPLLTDESKQVQYNATLAIGRIVQHDEEAARKLLTSNFLPLLFNNMKNENKFQKTTILFVLRSLCKHDAEIASIVVQSGAMNIIVMGLEDFEPIVKESAAWVTGYIAMHNSVLAQSCVDTGCVPLLILALQEANLSLKQIAASALSDIAKHNTDLAQNVVDAGAIVYLIKNLNNLDEKLKKQILGALSSCCKHSSELAEVIVDAEIFPSVYLHMAHGCPGVRKNATNLIKEIVKHSLELTQLVVNTGGIGALLEVLHQQFDECLIPCITALGYIAGHSEQLAMSILIGKAMEPITDLLINNHCNNNDTESDAIYSVIVWTLGQIGKHTPEHARYIAAANILPRLVQLYTSLNSSEDLKFKCKATLKTLLQKCLLLDALEPLLYDSPPNVLKYVLGQYSKILPNDPKARRLFVTTGALKTIQLIEAEPGTTLMEYITIINSCFPVEIVRYYSPGYPDTLLDQVEQYSPQLMTVLHETQKDDNETEAIMQHTTPSQELQNLLVG